MPMNATQKSQLESAGVKGEHAAQFEAIVAHPAAQAAGIDWSKLFSLIQQFGPVVLQILMSLFNVPAPPTIH